MSEKWWDAKMATVERRNLDATLTDAGRSTAVLVYTLYRQYVVQCLLTVLTPGELQSIIILVLSHLVSHTDRPLFFWMSIYKLIMWHSSGSVRLTPLSDTRKLKQLEYMEKCKKKIKWHAAKPRYYFRRLWTRVHQVNTRALVRI